MIKITYDKKQPDTEIKLEANHYYLVEGEGNKRIVLNLYSITNTSIIYPSILMYEDGCMFPYQISFDKLKKEYKILKDITYNCDIQIKVY